MRHVLRSSRQDILHLRGENLRSLIVRPALTLLGQEEGRLLLVDELDKFKTPPHPQLISQVKGYAVSLSDDEPVSLFSRLEDLIALAAEEKNRSVACL